MLIAIGWVALGGAAGAAARFLVSRWVHHWFDYAFPAGTLAVNVLGSFLIGLAYASQIGQGGELSSHRLVLLTGFLGGFTTFSAFSMELLIMFQQGQGEKAILYITLSLILSMGAVYAGYCTNHP